MNDDERLHRIAGLKNTGTRPPERRRRDRAPEEAVEAVTVTSFPLDHRHGGFPLGAILSDNPAAVKPLAYDLGVDRIEPRKLAFLDTETTGLSGGAGCLVFLVGLGRFTDDAFVVEQHLLTSPAVEADFLKRMLATLGRFKGVATFFGKAFDRPRLEDRFAFHRLRRKVPAKPHVDLHTLARRLFGESLPDCKLRTVEERILGFEREDDLPGELCPEAYRCFLNGDSYLLGGVIEHNRNDILSLAVLAHAVCMETYHPTSIRGRILVARGLETLDKRERAVTLLRSALADERRLAGNMNTTHRAGVALGETLKRSGQYSEAVAHWRAMADNLEGGIYAHVELAKFHEHQTGELAAALEHTLSAVKICSGKEAAALAHRAARLRRKRGEAITEDGGDALAPGSGSFASRLPLSGLRRRQDLDPVPDQA